MKPLDKKKRIENKLVTKQFSQRPCDVCGRPPPNDPHHIKTRGSGGDDTPENLYTLCRWHHTEIHQIGTLRFLIKYPVLGLKKKFAKKNE